MENFHGRPQGIPGNSIWEPHFGDLGGLLGGNGMAKVDMLGEGDVCHIKKNCKQFLLCNLCVVPEQ